MRGILKNKSFLFITSSHFIHKIAETLYDLALPLLVLYVTGSPVLMGIMYALGFFAEFLVGFFGGTIVDSINRKKLLVIISILQATFIMILPLTAYLNIYNIMIIFLVAFILDTCIALYRIADISIIPQIVKREELPQANGLMQSAISVAEAVGPAISGLIILAFGLFGSLWVNVTAFLLLTTTIGLIKYTKTPDSDKDITPKSLWHSSIQGLKYTLKDPLYRTILTWNIFINFGLSGAMLMVLFHLTEVMGLPPNEIGFVMTFSAIGGILSGLLFAYIQKVFKSGKLLLISSFITGVSLILFPLPEMWIGSALILMFVTFTVGINSRLIYLLFQYNVPEDMLGRVLSAARLVSTILAPLSVLLAGIVADVNSRYVFIGGGLIILVSTVITFTSNLWRANWTNISNEANAKSS
jgi:MFS family permease